MENQNLTIKRSFGILGLIGTFILIFYILLNLSVILYPISEFNLFGFFIIILSISLPFYHWLKMFVMMMFGKRRTSYFGLFPAKTTFANIISVVMMIVNIGTILFWVINSAKDADIIIKYDCSLEDGSFSLYEEFVLNYIAYMLITIVFWGFANLLYWIFTLDI